MRVHLCATSAEEWEPIPRWALACWLTFYVLFVLYALCDRSGFLLIDYVNLPVHEGGHLLFGWFGQTLGVLGGTLMQLLAPAALTVYFVSERQSSGTTFCAFFFFENLLNVSTYMADARAQQLCLVTWAMERMRYTIGSFSSPSSASWSTMWKLHIWCGP